MKIRSSFAGVIAVVALLHAAVATAAETPPTLRLPAGVRPTHGDLSLRIVPGQPTFSGSVDFTVELAAATRVIWLHAHDLALSDATVRAGAETIAATTTASGDFVGVTLPRAIGPGRALLHLGFSGAVSEAQIVGLFHVKDRDHDLVVSKFESIFARRAFPCFDEPSIKIPWRMTLHVRKQDAAFSNTPVVGTSDEPGNMKKVVFAETPPLPSYLVALAVGGFERVDVGTAGRNHVPIGLVIPAGHAGETAWARSIAPAIVGVLERYFDVAFPYPKLDLLIVPQYPGGMEDAGLILLGSTGLLGDPARMSIGEKRSAAHVLMHEVAHMWFGDLVTSAWWDDIWLNEAFASWADSKLVDEWQPAWKAIETVADTRAAAFAADALTSARRIRQPIATVDDILGGFDGITYLKGETVLAMLERWLGADHFRQGVHDYLVAHANGNATSADFVAAMAKAAARDVAPVFASFIDQPGIPSVDVRLDCAAGAPPAVLLEQHRFVPAGAHAADSTWQLPVCIKTPAGNTTARACTVMHERTARLALADARCPAWVLANDEEAGYYLALYPRPLLQALAANRTTLSLRERLGVVNDVSQLVEAGHVPAAEALRLVATFVGDDEPAVARAALYALADADWRLIAPSHRAAWRRFLVATVGPRARTLGWKPAPNEADSLRLLRPRLLGLAAIDGEDPALAAEGEALGRKWLDDRGAVDPDVRAAALTLAVRHGDAALFERLKLEASKEKDPTARLAILRAMVSFRDPALRQRGLDYILSSDVNGRETYSSYFRIASGDPDAQSIRLAFVEQRYDDLLARFPPNRVGDLVESLGQCDAGGRKRLAAFFTPRAPKLTGGPRALAHALEATDQCIAARATAGASLPSLWK